MEFTTLTESDKQRFFKKVNQTSNHDECWLWNAGKSKEGYGRFRLNRKLYQATHVSYFLRHNIMPASGQEVCHKCDNPQCVNPNHLFLGSRSDNMNDCYKKGRLTQIYKGKAKGERNGSAKVTNEIAEEIRRLYNLGIRGKSLTSRFKIHKTNIYRIIRGISYQNNASRSGDPMRLITS